ncbi:MAG: transposase, partial [Sedimentisphaerales bacterium]|nr:transposase [Sedimentisphaerales bacterium]
ASALKHDRRIHRQDEIDRIAIEGKFGQGKRRFTLDRIMAKLAKTSEATIAISFIVMNLEKILSALLYFLLSYCRMCRIPLRVYAAGYRNRHWDMQMAA